MVYWLTCFANYNKLRVTYVTLNCPGGVFYLESSFRNRYHTIVLVCNRHDLITLGVSTYLHLRSIYCRAVGLYATSLGKYLIFGLTTYNLPVQIK